MPSAAPTARLEARISTELHAMLKRAAEIQGRSLTDFVVSAVQEAAQRAIEQGEVVRLSLADSERFAQALLSPPDPSPALERAFARRRKLLRPTSKAQVKTWPSRRAGSPRRSRFGPGYRGISPVRKTVEGTGICVIQIFVIRPLSVQNSTTASRVSSWLSWRM